MDSTHVSLYILTAWLLFPSIEYIFPFLESLEARNTKQDTTVIIK